MLRLGRKPGRVRQWASRVVINSLQYKCNGPYGCIVTESLEGECVVDSAVDGAAGAAKRCKKGDDAGATVAGGWLSLLGEGSLGPPLPGGAEDVAEATASVEDEVRRILSEPDVGVVEDIVKRIEAADALIEAGTLKPEQQHEVGTVIEKHDDGDDAAGNGGVEEGMGGGMRRKSSASWASSTWDVGGWLDWRTHSASRSDACVTFLIACG